MNLKDKHIIFSVSNDLVNDRRIQKMAGVLQSQGARISFLGRKLKTSMPCPDDEIRYIRFRLLFNQGPLFYLVLNWRLFWKLLFIKADILVANDLDTLLPNYLVSKIRNKTLVYDTHELFTEVPELRDNPFKQKLWLKLEKWIFPKLKHVITVNESIARIYTAKYQVLVNVVRNLAPKFSLEKTYTKAELGLPDVPVFILQGTGINAERGGEEAVLAMKYATNALLLILGGGDSLFNLKQLVEAHGLQNKVRFMGTVAYAQLMKYTSVADVGLSLDKPDCLNYKYSLPNKIFDYLQVGTPILCSSVVEVSRIVKQYGIGEVLPEVTPEAIANGLQNMLSKTGKLQAYSENCLPASEVLNWEQEAGKVLEVYAKVCSS